MTAEGNGNLLIDALNVLRRPVLLAGLVSTIREQILTAMRAANRYRVFLPVELFLSRSASSPVCDEGVVQSLKYQVEH